MTPDGVAKDTADARGIEAARRLLAVGKAAGEEFEDPLTDEFATAFLQELAPGLVRRREGFSKDRDQGVRRVSHSLNVEPEHGLIEMIQNADDLGAHTVRIAVDDGPPRRLLLTHDGARVQAKHVYAMTVGLVSTKGDDAIAIGKFGIGLQTLIRLAGEFEVHCPPYHFAIADMLIRAVGERPGYPRFWDAGHPDTLFAMRLREDYPDDGIAKWFAQLQADDLIFLRSVRRLELTSSEGELLAHHELISQGSRAVALSFAGEPTVAQEQVLLDPVAGRRWTRLHLERPAPANLVRSDKAKLAHTPLAIAYPDSPARGRLFAGLPLAVGGRLPFSFDAQFDTDTPRTKIIDEAWNQWVLDQMVELAAAVAVQRFDEAPSSGWSAVPHTSEARFVNDGWLPERMTRAVLEIQDRVRQRAQLPGGDGLAPLSSFVAEAKELQDTLDEQELRMLAGEDELLVYSLRDGDDRWRRIMRELKPDFELSIEDALAMVEWPESRLGRHPGELFVRLAHCAIANRQQRLLRAARFVLLADGRRISPQAAKDEGLVLETDSEGGSLAQLLGLAQRVDAAFSADTDPAQAVLEYLERSAGLRSKPTDQDALRALAQRDPERPVQLDDDALVLLRDALAAAGDERAQLAAAIGRLILVDGVEYVDGEERELKLRPSAAYLPASLDTTSTSWALAAGRVAGLRWVHRRYARVLRRSATEPPEHSHDASQTRGDERLSPRSLFLDLGSEVAPQLHAREHDLTLRGDSAVEVRYADLALEQRAALAEDTPLRRRDSRGGLLDDYDCPALEAVCEDIRRDETADARRRALALIGALDRSWSRLYAECAQARIVHAHSALKPLGEVPATWRARAAEMRWMTDERGERRAPRELAIRTPAFCAMVGESQELYAYGLTTSTDATRGLAFASEPRASTLLERLRELRAVEVEDPSSAGAIADDVARIYRALDALVPRSHGTRVDDLTVTQLRAAFAAGEHGGEGLVRVADGVWCEPDRVFVGRAILGAYAHFVSGETERLWATLAMRPPSVADCVSSLHRVAESGSGTQERGLLGEVYRYMIEQLDAGEEPPSELRKLELWTRTGWKTERPIYAVSDPELQRHLPANVPLWEPPVSLDTLVALTGPLGVELLDESSFVVVGVGEQALAAGEALRPRLRDALGHLRDWLMIKDEDLHDRLTPAAWERLGAAPIALCENLHVDIAIGGHGVCRVPRKAHVQIAPDYAFAFGDVAVMDDPNLMGPQLARVLGAEDLAQDALAWAWHTAIAEVDDGRPPIGIRNSATEGVAHLSPDADVQPVADSTNGYTETSVTRPSPPGAQDARASSASPGGHFSAASLVAARRLFTRQNDNRRASSADTRRLQNLSDIATTPRWFAGKVAEERADGGDREEPREIVLREPDAGSAVWRATEGPTLGPASWTAKERETLGLDLLCRELKKSDRELTDLRGNGRVGADARDQHGVYYELKVHARAIPDSVTLTASEFQLAYLARENFVLVLIGGLEQGFSPIIELIPNPLEALRPTFSTDVQLDGIVRLLLTGDEPD